VIPCRSCEAGIFFAVTSKNGAAIPLDVRRSAEGNIVLVGAATDGKPLAHVLTSAELELARTRGTLSLFTTHLQTCPDAAKWRQPKGDA
jgi:hypothetical protein